MTTAERIYAEILELPEPERRWLLEELRAHYANAADVHLSEAWLAEIDRRASRPADSAETVPWEDVRRELLGSADRHRAG